MFEATVVRSMLEIVWVDRTLAGWKDFAYSPLTACPTEKESLIQYKSIAPGTVEP
jgi:hypothetical protein